MSEAVANWVAAVQHDRGTRAKAALAFAAGLAGFVLFCVEASRSTASGRQAHFARAWDSREEHAFHNDFVMPAVTFCPTSPTAEPQGFFCLWKPKGDTGQHLDTEREFVDVTSADGTRKTYNCVTVNRELALVSDNSTNTIHCHTGLTTLDDGYALMVSTWYPAASGGNWVFDFLRQPAPFQLGWVGVNQWTWQDISMKVDLFHYDGHDHWLPMPHAQFSKPLHTADRHTPADYPPGAKVFTFSISPYPGMYVEWQQTTLYSRNQMFGVVGGLVFLITWVYALSVAGLFALTGWGSEGEENRSILAPDSEDRSKYSTPPPYTDPGPSADDPGPQPPPSSGGYGSL